MGFTVNFYQFSKKENSTARPTGSPTPYQCTIIDSSGIISPTIQLNMGLVSDPSNLNYCYIPNFGRYYYVREWIFANRLWTASLQVDVLATYRSEIGSANLYVLRAGNEYDGRVVDMLYPTKVNPTFARTTKETPWEMLGSGTYIVGIVSREGVAGSVNYYALSTTGMQNLLSGLMDDVITTGNDFDLSEASKGLQLSLVDPIQYIKSAVFIPIPFGDYPGISTPGIVVYNWPIVVGSGQCKLLATVSRTYTYEFALQKHPQTNSRGSYVNCAPYTVITLSFPPFGVIEIDPSAISGINTLDVSVKIDLFTGVGILRVWAGDTLLNRIESQIGVPVQLSQVTRDYMGAFNNIMSAGQNVANSIGSFMTGNIGGGVSGIIGATAGIGNAAASMVPRSNTVGSGGAFAQLYENPRLDFQFFEIVDDDPTHNGRPLCKVRTPATLGGYMIIQDGDVSTTGTLEENREIKRYLETGFYYE